MSTTTKRKLGARLIAYLCSNPAYLSAWVDGFIVGSFVAVVAMAIGGAA